MVYLFIHQIITSNIFNNKINNMLNKIFVPTKNQNLYIIKNAR
jgi:hypothetical protein